MSPETRAPSRDGGKEHAAGSTGARRAGLRLGIAGKVALLMISFGVVTAVFVSLVLSRAAIEFVAERQSVEQGAAIKLAESRVASQIEAGERDVLFLTAAPAMQGFVRASSNGAIDPVDDSSLTLTRTRVGELFGALLTARPNYRSIHFLDQRGYETVQAERSADGLAVIVPPSDLRTQAREPFFAEAARLPAGAKYISTIEPTVDPAPGGRLNAGVVRFSTPVFASAGAFLGVVVITMDAEKIFNTVSGVMASASRVFLANERGDYVGTPAAASARGTRIQDDFPAVASLIDGSQKTYSAVTTHGSVASLFAATAVPFGAEKPARQLIIAAEQTVAVHYSDLVSSGLPIVGIAALVILMGGLTALVLLRILVVPLRRIRATAVNLAAGDRTVELQRLSQRNDEIGDLAVSIDAMARAIREHEDRLVAQAAELSRSNQDLAQFAYVASHDLQEPLRMVGSYLDLLSRRYKGKLDQEADEFIGFAVDGATRMKRLINDLLGYSRTGSTPLKREKIDIGDVLKNVLASLAVRLSETGGKVEVGPMPTIIADGAQIERVFLNLIDNALKYHSAAPPHIHVTAVSTEAGWSFTVADNGIGIDPRFSEQIFEIFKRLHGRDQYSGTGIGLAVTKLAVERHGGNIHVRPADGGGSAFEFEIPQARMDA
jgi:signal transduction histidine kinase